MNLKIFKNKFIISLFLEHWTYLQSYLGTIEPSLTNDLCKGKFCLLLSALNIFNDFEKDISDSTEVHYKKLDKTIRIYHKIGIFLLTKKKVFPMNSTNGEKKKTCLA